MKLPIPVVTIFFLSDLGKLIFIPFAITQVTRKRMIMKIIDVHLCSSSCSIPSKRNVAEIPPIMENIIRSQKSLFSLSKLDGLTRTSGFPYIKLMFLLARVGTLHVRKRQFCFRVESYSGAPRNRVPLSVRIGTFAKQTILLQSGSTISGALK